MQIEMDLFEATDDSQSLWSMQKAAPIIDEDPPVADFYESSIHPVKYNTSYTDVGSNLLSQPPPSKKKRKEKRGRGPETSNSSMGFGLGLSRGFQLWRALGSIRRCISRVTEPLSKVQRRSLRRRLTYHVDDLERIVVGVNPQDPYCSSDDTVSGDEELRDEVNSLIEDALDEAALQGKVVQTDYFETRVSFLEQQCSTLKKQLEEIASKKFVQETSDSSLKRELAKNEPRRGRCSDGFFSYPKGDLSISNNQISARGRTDMGQRQTQSDVNKSNVREDIIQNVTQKQEAQLQDGSTQHSMQPGQEVNICTMEQQAVSIHDTNTHGNNQQVTLAQIHNTDTETHEQKYKNTQEQVKGKLLILDESTKTHTMKPSQQKKNLILVCRVDQKMVHTQTKIGDRHQEQQLTHLQRPPKTSQERVGKHILPIEDKCGEQRAKMDERQVTINHASVIMHSNKGRKFIMGNCQTQNQPGRQYASIKTYAGPWKVKKPLKKISEDESRQLCIEAGTIEVQQDQVSFVSQPTNEQLSDQVEDESEKHGEGIQEEQIDPPSNEAQSDQFKEDRQELTGDGQTTNQLHVQGVPIKGKRGRPKKRKKAEANLEKGQKQCVQEPEGSDGQPFVERGSEEDGRQQVNRENVQESCAEGNQPTRPPKRSCVIFREVAFPRGMSMRIANRRMDYQN